MRILQVAHTFLPESSGGTEVHVYLLCKDLQPRHQAAVFYRIYAPGQPEHSLVHSEYDGIPVYKVVNNFTASLPPLVNYFDSQVERRFEEVLDEFRPDVVHFHHLGGGLSTSMVHAAKRRGLPVILTLHDFWYMCYLSTLFTRDYQRCPGPEGGLRCHRCYHLPAPEFERLPLLAHVQRVGVWGIASHVRRFITGLLKAPILSEQQRHTALLMTRDTYFRHLLTIPDALIAPSNFLKERFVEWGLPSDHIIHLPNGVNPASLEPGALTVSRGERLQFAYIGSIVPQKGVDLLVDAFNLLANAPVELHIYGDAEANVLIRRYAATLRARIANPYVHFEGHLPNREVGRVLARTDMFILPSRVYENCPMSILEALWAGVPVLTANIGGMAELIHEGKNGLLFRADDATHLAERVREVAANPSLLDKLRAGIVRPRTSAEVSRDLETIYEGLLARRDS